jgi:hypothetical protein
MTHKALAILKRTTQPKSPEAMHKFLLERHGATGRENASSDASALEDRARLTRPDPPQKK